MSPNKPSKSQRRKMKLIEKGAALAKGTVQMVTPVPLQAVAVRSNTNKRRRARSRRARAQGFSRNPLNYLEALKNPEFAQGTKVPDEIGYPTGTFQVEAQGVLSSLSGGDSVGICVWPIVGNGVTEQPIMTMKGAVADNINTVALVGWNARAAITGVYSWFRPVSMSLEVSFIGTSINDQGRICGGCTYLGEYAQTSAPTTWSAMQALPDVEVWPAKNGLRVVWKPLDNSDFEFVSYDTTDGSILNYPVLVAGVTGLSSASIQSTFMFRVIANFEAVPKPTSANIVDTQPSPSNSQMLAKAFDWAQQANNNIMPLVGVVGQAVEYGRQIYNAGAQAGLFGRGTGGSGGSRISVRGPRRLNSLTRRFNSVSLKDKSLQDDDANCLDLDESPEQNVNSSSSTTQRNVSSSSVTQGRSPSPMLSPRMRDLSRS